MDDLARLNELRTAEQKAKETAELDKAMAKLSGFGQGRMTPPWMQSQMKYTLIKQQREELEKKLVSNKEEKCQTENFQSKNMTM